MSKTNAPLTIVDKSTKALATAGANLTKTLTELNELSNFVPAMLEEIGLKQTELNQVSEQLDESVRVAKHDLKLKVMENEDKVLNDLLNKRGLANITTGEVESLRTGLESAIQSNEENTKKTVAIAVNSAKSELQLEFMKKENDWKITEAELKSQEKSAQDKVTMLEAQVESLQATIEAERNARIEIASSDSKKQGVVVNNGKL